MPRRAWHATKAGFPLDNWFSPMALAIDPVTPTTVYIGALYYGVFKSTDAGGNWQTTGLRYQSVSVLAVDPLHPATIYAGIGNPNYENGGGLRKTTDGGTTWSRADAGLPSATVLTLALDPLRPGILYTGTYGAGVFKTVNGGSSWTEMNTGLSLRWVSSLAIDSRAPPILYAGTMGGGVYSIEQVSACVGDCNNEGRVTVDDILTMVNTALGNAGISACQRGDANDDHQITVDEILTAVNNALSGCPS